MTHEEAMQDDFQVPNNVKLDSSHPEQGEQGELYRWVKASERELKTGWYENCGYEWRGEWIGGRHYFDGKSFTKGFMSDVISKESMYILERASPPPEGQDELFKDIFNTLISSGDYLSYDIRSSIESLKSKYLLIKK